MQMHIVDTSVGSAISPETVKDGLLEWLACLAMMGNIFDCHGGVIYRARPRQARARPAS